jgi:acyl-CoA thioesterase-2
MAAARRGELAAAGRESAGEAARPEPAASAREVARNQHGEVTREGLRLQQVASCDLFVGEGISTPWKRLFGGQTMAQSLYAASLTVPYSMPVHSMHGYFILAGDSNKKILFEVDRVRDGGSFVTRAVKAKQDNKVIAHALFSFHRREEGMSYQVSLDELLFKLGLKSLPAPDSLSGTEDLSQNIIRHTVASGRDWKVSMVRVLPESGLVDRGDWKLNTAMLTYMSDADMVSAVRRPFPDTTWAQSVSLDHSIFYHRAERICVLNWMCVVHTTSVSAAGRGLATAQVFDLASGDLLATYAQEALVRPAKAASTIAPVAPKL